MKVKEVGAVDVLNEAKKYLHHEENIELIEKALNYANEKHAGQFRKSGEPYIVHLWNVAYILATLRVGPKTIAAGILHDVIEDQGITKEELGKEFDPEIAELVESVTKISNLKVKDTKEYQAENHRKIFIAMAKDIRVILIKLVDRLHNMRTLQFMSREAQIRIAKETLEVYSPIAHRLGLNEIKNELEDQSFLYLNYEEYHRIAKLVEAKKSERDEKVKKMIEDISKMLNDENLQFRIFGRSKHLYSIYRKMTTKNKKFDEILDLLAIRIICNTKLECYEILGYIHAKYRPIPGRLKDYIAMPKMNMYQSLHTTIVGDGGAIFEIQIRTEEMDRVAELGIAAHWRYKEGSKYDPHKEQKEIEDKLTWLKEFAQYTGENSANNAMEYMDAITKDIFEANVYVMTPMGKIIDLPNGSTPIDFAYKIHTEVGDSAVGAIVNDSLVNLDTVLKTGDVVQIRTTKQKTGPSEDWLKFVKTNKAKSKIKAYLAGKEMERKEERLAEGEKIFVDELKKRGFDYKEYFDKKKIETIASNFGVETYLDLMYGFAVKSINPVYVIEKLTNQKRGVEDSSFINKFNNPVNKKKISSSKNGVIVEGVDSIMMSLAQCCMPVYGDNIVGFITKGNGVKIHRDNCVNVVNLKERLIDVSWDEKQKDISYDTTLLVYSKDRNLLLNDIVTVISQYNGSIKHINLTVNQTDLTTSVKIIISVRDLVHLNNIIANLKKVDSIISVERHFN